MTTILRDDVFKFINLYENFILSSFHWNVFPYIPIDNNSAFAEVMAWCRIGDKPLSEPMMFYFIDAHMHINDLNKVTEKFALGKQEQKLAPLSETTGCFIYTLRPKQNGHYFADDILKYIFATYENCWIVI